MKLYPLKISPLIISASLLVTFMAAGIFYSCSSDEYNDTSSGPSEMPDDHLFVGDETCGSCHGEQLNDWEGSHHDYAMKEAGDESVRGDFNDVSFTHRGDSYLFFRQDSLYVVETTGPDGEPVTYEVTHTFGWEPLQQYLVDFGKGKLQALNIAWDTEQEEWFALNPEEDAAHGDWMHWTGGAMNWNSMCADCHSTNLQENYFAEADSFHTTWSSINVSCESCHGPGRDHVDFVQSGEVQKATVDRIRRDLKLTANTSQIEQINQCAQCHSLREQVTQDYKHEGDFLDHFNPTLPHPESYYADGQIKEEVYVYGSFLQSRMFKNDVECSDCHDPHTLELKANVTDNTLCMSCHEPQFNTVEHHFHEPNTEASQCISCHMPGRYYMEVDFRRDHSFRVPRPDISKEIDSPNACNNCHEEQSPEWAADAIEEWYGPERPDHFSKIFARAHTQGAEAANDLQQMIADTSQPEIARATAVWYLGEFPDDEKVDLLERMLTDESPLVRNSAARAVANLPEDVKRTVLPQALGDSLRVVRLAAADGLAELGPSDLTFNRRKMFTEALEEYRQYLEVNRYFPQGEMNRGQYFEKQGETDKAIDAYRRAIDRDPHFNPARINLAHLLNSRGNNREAEKLLKTVVEREPDYGPAHYSLALLLAEEQRLQESLSYFEEAAEQMPDNARVRYNYAIALQTLERPEEAEDVYLEAIDLDPENPDYRYGISTLYIQQGQYRKALPHAEKLQKLQPNNPQIQNLLRTIQNNI